MISSTAVGRALGCCGRTAQARGEEGRQPDVATVSIGQLAERLGHYNISRHRTLWIFLRGSSASSTTYPACLPGSEGT
ncbi:hypothetical protein SRHO_G00170060 [Serrasalmus rhombeus]